MAAKEDGPGGGDVVFGAASSALDQVISLEDLRRLKNSRSGYLSVVTIKRNEIQVLLSREGNASRVKEKMSEFVAAFAAFQEAHVVYMSYLSDESSVLRCHESFERESVRKDDFIHEVQGWIKRSEEVARLDSQLQPEGSASQIVSRTSASRLSSRKSHRSSRSGSRGSNVSSLSVARAKESARVAELKAEEAVLQKRQLLEKQKFHLQLEKERLRRRVAPSPLAY
ncbi:fas-binding factor 1-like [Montipora capricornis]|uniref:fas-binding factor 1-like n=1 Tax=Montipora capricornis TaxID=246305 RepID=UPI0035F14BE5